MKTIRLDVRSESSLQETIDFAEYWANTLAEWLPKAHKRNGEIVLVLQQSDVDLLESKRVQKRVPKLRKLFGLRDMVMPEGRTKYKDMAVYRWASSFWQSPHYRRAA